MSQRRRRMGMFDHAKYSQPVLRTVPEQVMRQVKQDVQALLDPHVAATRAIPGRKRSHEEMEVQHQENEDAGMRPCLDGGLVAAVGGRPRDNQQQQQQVPVLEQWSRRKAQQQQAAGAPSSAVAMGGNNPPFRQPLGVNILASSFRPVSLTAATMGANQQNRQQMEPAEQRQYFPPDPTFTQVREALLAASQRENNQQGRNQQQRELLPPLLMQSHRRNPYETPQGPRMNFTQDTQTHYDNIDRMLASTPQPQQQQKQTTSSAPEEQIFPEKTPLRQIAAKLWESHPTITLRSNEPTTLSDACFSLARRALQTQKERETRRHNREEEEEYRSDFEEEENEETAANRSPYRTLSDQTMYLLDPDATAAVEADTEFRQCYMGESPVPEHELFENLFVEDNYNTNKDQGNNGGVENESSVLDGSFCFNSVEPAGTTPTADGDFVEGLFGNPGGTGQSNPNNSFVTDSNFGGNNSNMSNGGGSVSGLFGGGSNIYSPILGTGEQPTGSGPTVSREQQDQGFNGFTFF